MGQTYGFRVGGVQHVPQRAVGWPQQRPHGAGSLLNVPVLPLLAAVAQEGAEQAGVGVLHQLHLHIHTHIHTRMPTCPGL